MEKISPIPACLPMLPWQQGLSGILGSLPWACMTSGDHHCLPCRTSCWLWVREALKAVVLHCSEAAFWFLLLLPLSLVRSFQASPCCSPLPLHSGVTMATISQSLSTGSPGSVIGLHLWAYGAGLCCEPGVLPPFREPQANPVLLRKQS